MNTLTKAEKKIALKNAIRSFFKTGSAKHAKAVYGRNKRYYIACHNIEKTMLH